ncbi:hypothetical protein LPJ64_005604, partial [Coemansia asiatica]
MTQSNSRPGLKRSSPEADSEPRKAYSNSSSELAIEHKTPITPVVSTGTHNKLSASKSCSSTPSVSRSGHMHSHTNFGSTEDEVIAERKKEAKRAASKSIEIERVADIAIPRNKDTAQIAERIANMVSTDVER